MTATVVIFASTRADLGPLESVIRALSRDGRISPIVAAGSNDVVRRLSTMAGDGLAVRNVSEGPTSDDVAALVDWSGQLTRGVLDVLASAADPTLLVLGDRFEMLGAASAAVVLGVPIVHVHGGEITEGALDDQVRHAVTKLSHLHMCSTREAASRVIAMGEEPWRVHVTGAPGLDRLADAARAHELADVESRVGATIKRPFALLTYHPPTREPEAAENELESIIAACDPLGTVLVTAPGPDPGSSLIRKRLEDWASCTPNVVFVEALGELYPTALAGADVVIGNSSSGIIEAATFGVPVVNVGSRQRGRIRGPGTIDVGGGAAAVREAVEKALTDEWRTVSKGPNPYGDGTAAPRIVDIIAAIDRHRLLQKVFVEASDR